MGALSARGDHVNNGPRGMPLFVSGMQREVEVLRDALAGQHDLAEVNAAKVGAGGGGAEVSGGKG